MGFDGASVGKRNGNEDRANVWDNWSRKFGRWLESIEWTLESLILKQRPRIIIDSRENHAMTQQLLPGFEHFRDLQSGICCNVLHMQTLVALRRTLERVVDFSRIGAHGPYSGIVRGGLVSVASGLVLSVHSTAGAIGSLLHRREVALGEVEVNISGFQEVIGDFHLVREWADDVGANVAFVVEGLQLSPDTSPFILDKLGLCRTAVDVHRVLRVCIDPLFHFYCAGAIVEFVGDVSRLGGDVPDLTHEGYLNTERTLVSYYLYT